MFFSTVTPVAPHTISAMSVEYNSPCIATSLHSHCVHVADMQEIPCNAEQGVWPRACAESLYHECGCFAKPGGSRSDMLTALCLVVQPLASLPKALTVVWLSASQHSALIPAQTVMYCCIPLLPCGTVGAGAHSVCIMHDTAASVPGDMSHELVNALCCSEQTPDSGLGSFLSDTQMMLLARWCAECEISMCFDCCRK